MGRRRMYVFGAIVVVGVLIGFFCLPNSSDPTTAEPPGAPAVSRTTADDHSRSILPADVGAAAAAAKEAEELVHRARLLTDAQERNDCLLKAYRTDPAGRWGGEAAAEIAKLWKAAKDPAKEREWLLLARRAPVSPETLAVINAELAATEPAPARTAVSQVKTLAYKVQAGDSLWKIARRYATTAAAIKKVNNLTSDAIRVDTVLKVPKGPFDVSVKKSSHTLQLLQEGQPVKAYEVGIGDENNPTPAGSFVVQNKLENPVWYSDGGPIPPTDPRNMLGSRWIGINGRIGIHGCRKTDENTIGKDVSNGCIRLRDADVQELYNFLAEGKSKVTVLD